jgi:hypothetical protein
VFIGGIKASRGGSRQRDKGLFDQPQPLNHGVNRPQATVCRGSHLALNSNEYCWPSSSAWTDPSNGAAPNGVRFGACDYAGFLSSLGSLEMSFSLGAKGYRNQKLVAEHVSDLAYQPHKCQRKHRLVILRKNISVQQGERMFFDEVRYFFYLTNRSDLSVEEVVSLANGRCDQKNVIEQLKNRVNAMRIPVDDLVSNWAYMVMAALAWNFKAWYGMLVPNRSRGLELVRMEF